MSKRLIVLLALVFVLGVSLAAYAEVQNVKVSGDITAYAINQSQFGFQHKAGLKTKNAFATVSRVRVDADLTDNVMATVRLLNERYWGSVEESGANNTNVDVDLAYVTLKEFLYSPLTLMVGRQELHYGSQMVVGDPDTNGVVAAGGFSVAGGNASLTARKSFDSIRAVLNYDPLIVDLVVAKINENALKNSDDTDLYGVNAAYKLSDTTNLEGYWFTKKKNKKQFTSTNKADIVNTIGARLGNTTQKDNMDLTSSLEGAYQLGKYNGDSGRANDRSAYALEGAVTAGFKNAKYTPSVTVLAALFSGKKDPGTTSLTEKRMTGWDPMFENQSFGDIANQLLQQSNARILGGMVTMKPADDLVLKGEYYAFWWDKKYHMPNNIVTTQTGDTLTMTDKRFVGQEIDVTATYNYTEDVQFNLLGGLFIPGSAVSRNNPTTGTGISNKSNASEVIGSMKVTF